VIIRQPRRLWTEHEHCELRRMVAAGDGLVAIAKALGRTRHAIGRKLWGLQLLIDPASAAERRVTANRARLGERRGGWKLSAETKAKMLAQRLACVFDPVAQEARLAKMRETCRTPECRARASISMTAIVAKRLQWCPAPFLPDYHALRSKGFSAAERRAMLEPAIAKWLHTFEGRMWKVSVGRARLVPNYKVSLPISCDGPLISCTLAGSLW